MVRAVWAVGAVMILFGSILGSGVIALLAAGLRSHRPVRQG
jgi:hypothetical protein